MHGGVTPSRTGRRLFGLAAFVALIVGANLLAAELLAALDLDLRPSNEDRVHRTLMTAAVVYMLLIAIPFVPAVEIGIVLMALFGPAAALLVYLCTLAGLLVGFFAGRLVQLQWVSRLCADLRLQRIADLLERLAPLDREARLAALVASSPRRVLPWLLRHRHLTLAVALNLPGNVVLGGGGGIALTSGASRLYSAVGFAITIVFAVAPVPLAVLLVGTEFLGR